MYRLGRHATLVLACSIFLAAGLMLSGLGPILGILAQQTGSSLVLVGGMFTAFSVGAVLAPLILNQFTGLASARVIPMLGAVLMGLGTIGISQSNSFTSLLAAALLAGLGFSGIIVTINQRVAQLFPQRSASALNALNLFFGVGAVVGPLLASLAAVQFDLPLAGLWLSAGLLLALAPLLLLLALPASRPSSTTSGKRMRLNRSVWWLGLLLLLYAGTEIATSGWTATYVQRSTGVDAVTAALVASGFWSAFTLGRLLGAVLCLRYSSATLLHICLLGILLSSGLLAGSSGHLLFTAAAFAILGIFCGPVFPLVIDLAANSAPDHGTALVVALANCGGIIIPLLQGALLGWYGPPGSLTLTGATALVMLVLYRQISPRLIPRPI